MITESITDEISSALVTHRKLWKRPFRLDTDRLQALLEDQIGGVLDYWNRLYERTRSELEAEKATNSVLRMQVTTLNGRLARAENAELEERCERYEEMLLERGAFYQAPCFICGHDGPGYYQPLQHPCSARHYAAIKRLKRAALGAGGEE